MKKLILIAMFIGMSFSFKAHSATTYKLWMGATSNAIVMSNAKALAYYYALDALEEWCQSLGGYQKGEEWAEVPMICFQNWTAS